MCFYIAPGPRLERRVKKFGRERPELGQGVVLLSNLRWERRLLRFLELSGVGRVVEDG